MLKFFSGIKLASGKLIPRTDKPLYWNIDHLLNRTEVEISSLVCVRIGELLEAKIGKRLELKAGANVIEQR